MCTFMSSLISQFSNSNRINIRRLAVKSGQILVKNRIFFTLTQGIFIGSAIGEREVRENLKLNIIHVEHFVIQSEFRNLISARNLDFPVAGSSWRPAKMPQSRICVLFNRFPPSREGPKPDHDPY